ncbi:hypothetical protein TRFO_29987 [Tritrichomonas foetus]|uniref:Uncharacterized protein n=1 Tax=Tritrichomonas foetus TaxID=1144522 RepID=A0A1J4JZ69_9EUKA|nr:hypothetical protein TRFO_29987 [Tritrichomonas foetus]|eukprot:OHT02790.1 hypothetical protein TRFO_29987 [Tritrichomonas foetus]
MEDNLLNLRVYIIIGNNPAQIDNNGIFCNYELFSTAQLIQKIMHDVFNVQQSNIITFAYGKDSDYQNLLEKTQGKIITQITQNDVLFLIPSDISYPYYKYFETPENLISIIEIDESEIQNSDIFLFLLDHGSDGHTNNMSYIQIYQAILNSRPKSLRIFNDCCYDGSLISSTQHYSNLYHILAKKEQNEDQLNCINASFISLYISIAISIGIDLFFEKIDWITQYFTSIQTNQLKYIELFLINMKKLIKSKTLELQNPNIPILDYIDEHFQQNTTINRLKSVVPKILIQTSGELIACVAAVYNISKLFSKELKVTIIKSLINQNNTNIFLELCGENKKAGIYLLENMKVNYKSIYPPTKDLRIFSSSSICSRAFTFASIHISPHVKVICGSPGASEMIHELFLRNTNQPINFHSLKRELTTTKDGFKEYPVLLPVTDGKHKVAWARLFPKHFSDSKKRNDRLLTKVQSNVMKKISAMRGIKKLVGDEIERIKKTLEENTNETLNEDKNVSENENLNENIIDNSYIPKEFQKSQKPNEKETWKEKTGIARISENEIREISSLSLISILSSQIPFEESLKIIQNNLSEEQTVITYIAILSGRNSFEAGLIAANAMIELTNTANTILHKNQIKPTAASRSIIIKQSNITYLMILSGIAALINFTPKIDFTYLIEKIKNCQNSIISQLYTIFHKKLINKGIDEIHHLMMNELSNATTSLKNLVNCSIVIMNDCFKILTNLSLNKVSGKALDNNSEIEMMIQQKSGSSYLAKDSILSTIFNPIFPKSILSMEVIDLLSNKILEVINKSQKEIINLINKNNNPEIYEVIASNLCEYYSSQEMEKNISRIVAYKLRETCLDFIFFPRNPRDINLLLSKFPNNQEKVIPLLIDALTEISEAIFTPFKIEGEFKLAESTNDNYHNNEDKNIDEIFNKSTSLRDKNSKHQYSEMNDEDKSSSESFEEELNLIDTKEEENETQTVALNFKKNHPHIGIIALIEIISSYYLNDNPITIPIINIMKEDP